MYVCLSVCLSEHVYLLKPLPESDDETPLKHGIVLFAEDLDVISLPEIISFGFHVHVFSDRPGHDFSKYWTMSPVDSYFICIQTQSRCSKADMYFFLPIPFTCLINRDNFLQGISRFPLNISRSATVDVSLSLEKLLIFQSCWSMPNMLNRPQFDAVSNLIRIQESSTSKCSVRDSKLCRGRGLFVNKDVVAGIEV